VDAWRLQGGAFVGKVLGGARPADLPVGRPARILRADQVIE